MSMCILVIVVVSADECDCHLNVTDPLGRVIRPTKSFQLIGISNAEVVFYSAYQYYFQPLSNNKMECSLYRKYKKIIILSLISQKMSNAYNQTNDFFLN